MDSISINHDVRRDVYLSYLCMWTLLPATFLLSRTNVGCAANKFILHRCMIYCILIHFLCLKESLIFLIEIPLNLSYKRSEKNVDKISRNFTQSIFFLVDRFRSFLSRGAEKRTAHLTHFCESWGLIENYNNFLPLASWNIWLQIITIIKELKMC